MSDRVRVVLIFAVVALIAGGAGFYFFAVYQPGQQLEAARTEIAGWEARYQDARRCLLGTSPGSTKTSEALAIREMAPDPWDRKSCTPLVSKLSRGIANDTGVEAVEAAWLDLDKAAQQAALAFATHVGSSTTVAEDPLPRALDDLDAARGRLRDAAKLPAAAQAGTPLAPAEIVALVDGKEPVTNLTIDAAPSAHGLVAFGRTDSHQVQVVLAPGGAPKVLRVGPGSIRAVPDTSWGATPSRLVARGTGKRQDSTGEVQVGAMDAEGAIASPTPLAVTASVPDEGNAFGAVQIEPGEEVGSVMLAAVSGSLANGALVYGAYRTLGVAHVKDGALTAEPQTAIESAIAATDLDGRIALVWTAPDASSRARLLGPAGDETFELPASVAGSPCVTADRVWAMAKEPEVFAFGGGRPLARLPVAEYSVVVGCTGDAAIVHGPGRGVAICRDVCREVQLPSGAPENAAITSVGGKLRAIATHGGVLGVWSEGGPPVFYALPVAASPARARRWPVMALTDGKVIDVIARGAKHYVVIRIPAT